jgi:hypothetical protein
MRGHPLALLALMVGIGLASAGRGVADDEPLPEYPKAGGFIPGPFHVLNMNGDRPGRYHCLVCKYATLPTVALLVRLRGENDKDDGVAAIEPDQPLGKLLKRIDQVLEKHYDGNMGGFVVFVGHKDDRVPVQTRLLGDIDLKKPSLIKEQDLKQLIFGFDDVVEKATSFKYFTPAGQEAAKDPRRGIPEGRFVKVVMFQNYKLLYDVRDYTGENWLTDKDAEAIVADVIKMQPRPVVNRKKYQPMLP